MTKLIVILGITGNQGASVADVFLQERGWKLRGVTRDLTKASSSLWIAKGVEMVEADVDDPGSLDRAFKGASAIFAVTDFWGPMYDPLSYAKLRSGQSINEYCYGLEMKRGINIANAAALVDSLERFVFSSLPNIKAITKGKYRHVYHFDAKADVVTYIKDRLPELHMKTSELQLGEFATNWQVWRLRRPNKQLDGSYSFLVPGNINGSIAIVVPRKDTGFFVRALVMLPPGKTLLGYGSILNHQEYASLWTRELGVPNGGVRQVTVEEAAAYEGGPHGLELAETVASVMELDLTSPDLLHPSQIPPEIGCPTTSIEEYLRNEDFSAMLDV
ncbi:conserved hypothetical protein [Paecilomyces variotii No. 5]|uniref:NmrA-like domain-containing protein n=1 Tax=Byssochlamys spectabilis (strain No. 5 / NBRC 109023) TaxID=1356009 RepID=V5I321_BYSSN|nr:conserved hypothetical protein [Paecilomyces variotii No. 5]